jgi:GNAT superfamily N-acetyltransferase
MVRRRWRGSLAAVADNSPWSIRRAALEDGDFMADMLVETANWSPEWKKKSRDHVLSAPSTAHYIAGWPRETDLGVIAQADGEPIGAAWLRFFPSADSGYGFVAPDVPELTIGVVARWRGRGVGRALLRAAAALARSAGIPRISLSVERKNFAQKLYLSEGYQVVDSSDANSDTMVIDLALGRELGAEPVAPFVDAFAGAGADLEDGRGAIDRTEVGEERVQVELEVGEQVGLVHHYEGAGPEHHRVLQRLVLALGDRVDRGPGVLADVEFGGADQVADVLDEHQPASGVSALTRSQQYTSVSGTIWRSRPTRM